MISALPNDAEFIRLWHTDEPTPDIRERLNIKEPELAMIWRRLKLRGRLPMRRRARISVPYEETTHFDGRPSVHAYKNDPLLKRLRQIHGHGHRARAGRTHTAPRADHCGAGAARPPQRLPVDELDA
jgi:hypothetical protein